MAERQRRVLVEGVEIVVDEKLRGELAADGSEIVDCDLGTAEELRPGLSGGGVDFFGERRGQRGCGALGFKLLLQAGAALLLGLKIAPCLIADEADAAAMGSEAAVRVVDAEVKAELGARGEHAVRLAGSLADEIVDENAGVGFAAIEREGRLAFEGEGGVDSGHESLAGGFLVTAGAVDLSAEIESADFAGLEGAFELGGIDGVVLDGVTGTEHFGVLETGDGGEHGELDIDRERSAHAVDVDLVGVEALGFEEKLMGQLVGKGDDFGLDGGTVARADGLDLATVHGRAMDVFANDAMSFRRGVDDVAGHLGLGDAAGAEAERSGIGVTVLRLKERPVDGAAIEAGRGPGLEAAVAEAERLEIFAEKDGGGFATASGGIGLLAAVDESVEERSGGDDDGAGAHVASIAQAQTLDAAAAGRGFGVF